MNARPYESADLRKVIETYTASIHQLAAAYYSREQIEAWAPVEADLTRWEERLATLHTVVVESGAGVAGFASYNDDGYLDLLFTHPGCARRGVARSLLQRIESELQRRGIIRVMTHSSLAARPFFDQQGFVVDAEECVECRGVMLRRFAMHKLLHTAAE